MATFLPAIANRLAIANPMPDEAPTTMHVPLRETIDEGDGCLSSIATASLPRSTSLCMIRIMRIAGLGLLAYASLLQAQDPSPARPAERHLFVVDQVVATVNDGAIMLSELRTLAAGQIRTLTTKGRPLSTKDIEDIFRFELDGLIDKHRMAQAAKTFGVFTPEQIETFFKNEMEKEEQEKLRDLGSYQEFSRELKREGRTWQTFLSEQRVDKMADFAREFAVGMRLQKQSNLYLTPRMLRETYAREKDYFVHPALARVSILVFRGNDALATAQRAAAAWREEDIDARRMADRFPDAIVLDEVSATSLAPELAAITTFALAGPLHNVSPPMVVDGAVRLAKITDFGPTRNGKFEDPDVQADLRNLCEKRVRAEFLLQALERAKLRTEVWESETLFNGGRPARR